ncbi:MAG: hypothetical protein HY678_07400 [Chloroflexi bacterium]|nr:hypothetical protein [Chloroflexota bacterium]
MAGAIRPDGRAEFLIDQALTSFAAASLLLGAGAFLQQEGGWSVTFEGVIPEPHFPGWVYTLWSLGLLFFSAYLGFATFIKLLQRPLRRFRLLFRLWMPALGWCGLLAGWLSTLSQLEQGTLPYDAFLWVGLGWVLLLGVRLLISALRAD